MSNIYAFFPAVTFCTQSWFLTQFALLPTLSGFVPPDLFLCSLCSIVICSSLPSCFLFTSSFYLFLQMISAWGQTGNTFWQYRNPILPSVFETHSNFFHYKKKQLCYPQSLNPSEGWWRLPACFLCLQMPACCYLNSAVRKEQLLMERPASRNHLEAFSADTTDIVASANRYAAAEATLNLAKDFVQQSKHEKKYLY